ncbi:MAG: PA2779 family protein [Nitrospirota bacterium]|nr:PA2779 family protein [Nitrospirota bacterium]
MTLMRRIVKPLVPVLIAAFFNMTMPVHPVSAAMVGTDAVIDAGKAQSERTRVLAFLERDDVRTQMLSLGISNEEAQARVASLTDSEISRVAAAMDQLPAGGDVGIIGALLFIFIVLLFTDILGLTHIFPAISGKR